MKKIFTLQTDPFSIVLWLCVFSGMNWIINLASSFGIHAVGIIIFGCVIAATGTVRIKWEHFKNYFLIVTLIYIHLGITAFIGPCKDSLDRALIGVAGLSLIIFMILVVSSKGGYFDVFLTIRRILVFVTLTVVINATFHFLFIDSYVERYSGIFSEPSHLALYVAPLLALLMISRSRSDRLVSYSITVILLLLSASSTLILMLIACSVVLRITIATGNRLRSIIKITIFTLIVLGIASITPYWSEFIHRIEGLDGLDKDNNISSLIYLNGWLMASENFSNSYGLGLGVNRMGCYPLPQTELSHLLFSGEESDDLLFNYNDGSFLASKLISEVGIFFIFIFITFFLALKYHIEKIRLIPDEYSKNINLLCIALISAALAGMFIRSTGYFSPSFILGVYSICILRRNTLKSGL